MNAAAIATIYARDKRKCASLRSDGMHLSLAFNLFSSCARACAVDTRACIVHSTRYDLMCVIHSTSSSIDRERRLFYFKKKRERASSIRACRAVGDGADRGESGSVCQDDSRLSTATTHGGRSPSGDGSRPAGRSQTLRQQSVVELIPKDRRSITIPRFRLWLAFAATFTNEIRKRHGCMHACMSCQYMHVTGRSSHFDLLMSCAVCNAPEGEHGFNSTWSLVVSAGLQGRRARRPT